MDLINPIATSLYQSAQLQEQQASEKQRHVRRTQTVKKNAAAEEDQFEHQVESTEELTAIHDEAPGEQQPSDEQNKPKNPEEETSDHLDLTA